MFTLLGAASSIHDFVESRLSTVGLSIPRLAALQRLVDAGGSLPLGQLADRLACVKSNVTQLVDRLEAEGLVTRSPDPEDKRSRLAIITDVGRRIHQDGAKIQHQVEEELFATLSVDDAARLSEIVAKLKSASKSGNVHCVRQLPVDWRLFCAVRCGFKPAQKKSTEQACLRLVSPGLPNRPNSSSAARAPIT
jgi:DNA-binding MarR family transcriptional regulator